MSPGLEARLPRIPRAYSQCLEIARENRSGLVAQAPPALSCDLKNTGMGSMRRTPVLEKAWACPDREGVTLGSLCTCRTRLFGAGVRRQLNLRSGRDFE